MGLPCLLLAGWLAGWLPALAAAGVAAGHVCCGHPRHVCTRNHVDAGLKGDYPTPL